MAEGANPLTSTHIDIDIDVDTTINMGVDIQEYR